VRNNLARKNLKRFASIIMLTIILLPYQNYASGFDATNGSDASRSVSPNPSPVPVPGPGPVPITARIIEYKAGDVVQPVPDKVIYDANDPTNVHVGPNPVYKYDPNNYQPWGYSIVYTSSPRKAPQQVAGAHPGEYPGVDLLKGASEVARINSGFEETDLEIKDDKGNITVIYNCTTNSVQNCAAQEGRVSPDGTKIAYSLGISDALTTDYAGAPYISNLISAQIYIYNIATKTNTVIPNQGANVVNRMPDWLSNTELVYVSDAANKYPLKDQWNCHLGVYPAGYKNSEGTDLSGQPRGYSNGGCISQTYGHKATQIYKMKIDGTGQTNLTPHEYMAIRPTVLKYAKDSSGNRIPRIVYSSWQNAEDKGFYQGSAGPGTVNNLWWLMSIDTNGGDQMSVIGAHHSGYINKNYEASFNGTQVDQLMAVRAVGEDIHGRIYFTNYYRGNHFGLGNPYRMTVKDFHVEGCTTQKCYDHSFSSEEAIGSGQYIPEDLFSVAPFGVGSDNTQNKDRLGRATGKLGFAAGLRSGRMLATYGQGWCYIGLDNEVSLTSGPNIIADFLGGQPVCDRQIVELLVDRVNDPFDPSQMKIIAGDPAKHEWDAQEIPLAATPTPAVTPALTGNTCFLEVVDMKKSELTPEHGHEWRQQDLASQVGVQGNAVGANIPNFYANNVRSLALYGVALWDIPSGDPKFSHPNQTTLNYHGFKDKWLLGAAPMDPVDGSIKVQVPCNQPLQMSGLDAEGTVIAHDTTLHSLRPGETRTCKGCHEGHSVEVDALYIKYFPGKSTKDLFATTNAAKLAANAIPFLNGLATDAAKRVTWPEVAVIISSPNRCAGCHGGFQNDALLWSRVAADQEQLDFLTAPNPFQKKLTLSGYFLPRPYFSRLVARHPRWSPLYWGCVNKRNDGYTNASFNDEITTDPYDNNDIDFHEPAGGHLAAVRAVGKEPTAAECKKIAEWIQLGAPNK
jgi:Hydrazine synthase alpha subunit middle domain